MNIFSIYWNNVGINLIPSFWRNKTNGLESDLVPTVRSILAPVQLISDELLELQQDTKTYLDYNGQDLALESYLNDTYDNVDRRIFITENNIVNGAIEIDLYLQSESDATEISVYLQGESPPIPFSLYLQGETISPTYNFTINVPMTVFYDPNILTKQVKNYAQASKTFNIITF